MIKINLTNNEVIKAYMEALGSAASTVKIDRTLSREEQINMLSVSLNTMTAINKFIPVNYTKFNNLEFVSYSGDKASGVYTNGLSKISIVNMPENSDKNAKLAITLAHEYGHHIYSNILTSEDSNLIKRMESLIEKMGDTFVKQDHSILDKLENNPKAYDAAIDYLSSPTEMFARAFSGLVLKDMELSFEKGTCSTHNFTVNELQNFEKELKDICSAYSQKVLLSCKEPAINRNLFKNLSFEKKAIICKNENLLYHKNVAVKKKENQKNQSINAEDILRKKTYTDIFNSTTKEYQKHLKFDSKSDIYLGDTFGDMVDNVRAMKPNEVYNKEQALLNEKDDIEKTLRLCDNAEKIKKLNIRLEAIDIDLKVIDSSGMKERDDFKYYAGLQNKKKSIYDFLNKFDVTSDGKIASRIEKLRLVQFIKKSIVDKFDMKLSNIENDIKDIEHHFNTAQMMNKEPIEYYACGPSSNPNHIHEHNSNMLVGKYENGYRFGMDKHLRKHQLARKHLENFEIEENSIHPDIYYCRDVIDDTFKRVKKGISTYRELNSSMHKNIQNKVKKRFKYYKSMKELDNKSNEKSNVIRHNNALIDSLLKKAEEKESNRSNIGVSKQINDLLLKYSNKEQLNNTNIYEPKEIEKNTEIEL